MTTVERYRIADLLVDAARRSVERGGERLDLPPLSFALLVSLLRRAPDVVSRRELMDDVWEGVVVGDETLSQRVRSLREALGDDATHPRYVESVRGWGYRIAAPVERPASHEPAVASAVAVLPFTNLGGLDEDVPLCEGLAEEVITALTRIEGLPVIARTSSFAVSRIGLDAREIGRRLRAAHLLEGSVRRAGDRVRITVQLVETSGGVHLWSESFDRELRDVLELEDDIASAVASRLQAGLDRRPGPHTEVVPEAYRAYLEGRYHFARANPDALDRAKACFDRAIELDPRLPGAFDALAELYWYLGFFGWIAPREAFGQSTWCSLRALELDDTLAETHALLGMLRKELDYNWVEVQREVDLARALNPSSPAVRLRYAVSALLPHGRMEEALAEVDQVLTQDPLSLFVHWWSGAMALLARRPARVMDEARFMIDLDPGYALGHWTLGMALDLRDDFEPAVAAMARADDLAHGSSFTAGWLALVLGHAGRHDAVNEILANLSRASARRYVSPFASALGYIGIGAWDEAFLWIDRAVDERDPLAIPIKTYSFLDPVLDDPRYLAVLEKMNLA